MISNYVNADIWRISKRIPRIIAILFVNIVFAVVIVKASTGDSWNSVFFMDKMLGGFSFVSAWCGIVEFIAVFSDDFKAKTMQVAIGAGIKRRHVILTKWIDCMFLLLSDLVFVCIVGLLTGMATGVHVNTEQLGDLLINVLGVVLKAGAYYSLTMIPVFFLQSVMISLIIYFCLSTGLVYQIFQYLFSLEAIRSWNLDGFLLTSAGKQFISRLIVGTFDIKSFLLVLVYAVVGYVVSSLLFRKKELEF